MFYFANLITLSRIALTPLVVFFMMQNSWDLALAVFMVAVATDVIDGWVARTFHQGSVFGQILDPIADKILFGSVMIAMLFLLSGYGLLFFTLCFLMVKETVLLVGGGILWFGYQKFIPPSKLSRQVSWYEFIFMFAVMIDQIDYLFMSAIVLVVLALINIILSSKLLIRYVYKLVRHDY